MKTLYAEFNEGLPETFERALEILELAGYSFDSTQGKVGFSRGRGGKFGEIIPNYSHDTLTIEMGKGEIPGKVVKAVSENASYFR